MIKNIMFTHGLRIIFFGKSYFNFRLRRGVLGGVFVTVFHHTVLVYVNLKQILFSWWYPLKYFPKGLYWSWAKKHNPEKFKAEQKRLTAEILGSAVEFKDAFDDLNKEIKREYNIKQ